MLGIVKNGLLIYPNERRILKFLTSRLEFDEREPQSFGMVSLHGFTRFPNPKAMKKFGSFGIEFERSFIKRIGFFPVEYVAPNEKWIGELRNEVQSALDELDQRVNAKYPEDSFFKMAYTNMTVSRILGGRKWENFLARFEFMEPKEHQFEQEWRYARAEPLYYDGRSKAELIAAISDVDSFARHTFALKTRRDDILRFYAPAGCGSSLRALLPDEYKTIEIVDTRFGRFSFFKKSIIKRGQHRFVF